MYLCFCKIVVFNPPTPKFWGKTPIYHYLPIFPFMFVKSNLFR